MSIGYSTALRNARLDEITAAIDAAATPGKLRIYAGTQPATGASVAGNTLLAELTMGDPSFPAASGGSMTANAISADSSANATGTATFARVLDGDDNFVMDLSIDELNLNTTSIVINLNVAVLSWVITSGHA